MAVNRRGSYLGVQEDMRGARTALSESSSICSDLREIPDSDVINSITFESSCDFIEESLHHVSVKELEKSSGLDEEIPVDTYQCSSRHLTNESMDE
ncbi:hypothetical protein DNTS_023144 [Danionella cerebrum]|uniref:Uncharacterized protein n=1 Tax=Danionella cerebrum TaxID=2873325 RepID=A0A553NJ08_9TELE|nr:hypothetical protein DNTS_023144 [Danionella translucida]